jgi:cell division protein FtsI (penicillin-binding protein 3)
MGTTKLALSVPKEFLLDKFFDAGFGSETGSGLVGENSGVMHDRHRWSQFELATLSFGYGLTVTPIQLARLYGTLANGGVRIPLTILKTEEQVQGERVFSEKETKFLLTLLEGVVADGGASKAKVDGYRVGGKTGTSRKAANGGYGNEYVGLFAGVAPISKPELSVVVVINEPGGDLYHGGDVAAPVFARVMKGALHILNIAPDAPLNVANSLPEKVGGNNV